MPQSLAKIYVHLIFSTKNREPLVSVDLQERLYPYLSRALKNQNSPALKIGGVADHVHILFRLSRTDALAAVIGQIKSESTLWVRRTFAHLKGFSWQGGYGAFSVSPPHLESVTQYIVNQAEHHRTRSFEEEFRAFLERYEIEYDERYVWD